MVSQFLSRPRVFVYIWFLLRCQMKKITEFRLHCRSNLNWCFLQDVCNLNRLIIFLHNMNIKSLFLQKKETAVNNILLISIFITSWANSLALNYIKLCTNVSYFEYNNLYYGTIFLMFQDNWSLSKMNTWIRLWISLDFDGEDMKCQMLRFLTAHVFHLFDTIVDFHHPLHPRMILHSSKIDMIGTKNFDPDLHNMFLLLQILRRIGIHCLSDLIRCESLRSSGKCCRFVGLGWGDLPSVKSHQLIRLENVKKV